MRTLYDLLNVPPDADEEALNKAYRTAAKAHHPDLNAGDPDAARRFGQIATAIEILRNTEQRAAYDRRLECEGQRVSQRRRSRWNRIIIIDALAAAVLIIVLVAGYTLVRTTFSTVTSKVENGDEPPRRVEQGPTIVAVSNDWAGVVHETALARKQDERRQAAEREDALRRQQEERQQIAERERQAAEHEDVLRREQEERRRAVEPERQMIEREEARRREHVRPAVIALREGHRARQLVAAAQAAESAPPTLSEPSASPPRNVGPAEIAATRAFARF
jgi:curved DNA-binding protein CbpA